MPFDFNADELERKQAEANQKKQWLTLAGGIGDALASQQSFGNFFTGKMNPQSTTVSRTAGAMADSITDPFEFEAKKMQAYKGSVEAKRLADEDRMQASNRDPNSTTSKAKKAMAMKYGIEVTPEMSGYDVDQLMDTRKMNETEASSRVNFQNQKALKEMDISGDLRRERMKLEMESAKKNSSEPSAEQYKAAGFAQRIQSSEKIMNELAKAGFDGNDRRSWVQKNLYNEAKPVELQKMEQAQRNFINAVLRRESGAVISPEEFDNARLQYFPQAGDSREVLEQKRQNRLDVLSSISTEAGRALGRIDNTRAQYNEPSPYQASKDAGDWKGSAGISKANAAGPVDYDKMTDEELAQLHAERIGEKRGR